MITANRGGAMRVSVLVLLCVTLGCGTGERSRSNVRGKISYQGQPLTTGMLTFHPAGGGSSINCSINRDGTYRMTEAPVGKYTVTVVTPPKPAPGQKASARPNAPVPVYVPEKFTDPAKSDLVIDISPNDTEVDISLGNP